MVVFMEGPADGQRLMLRRIPIMLRVVQNRSGEWDALNELDDQADDDEVIHVYRRADELGDIWKYHLLCRRGAGRKGGPSTGWYWNAAYRYFGVQPPDEDLRTNARWQAWATANAPKQEIAQ